MSTGSKTRGNQPLSGCSRNWAQQRNRGANHVSCLLASAAVAVLVTSIYSCCNRCNPEDRPCGEALWDIAKTERPLGNCPTSRYFWTTLSSCPLTEQTSLLRCIEPKTSTLTSEAQAYIAGILKRFSAALSTSPEDFFWHFPNDKSSPERPKYADLMYLYITVLPILMNGLESLPATSEIDGYISEVLDHCIRLHWTSYVHYWSTIYLLTRGRAVPETARTQLEKCRDWRIRSVMKRYGITPGEAQ